jgi:hypothetical protein
VAQAQRRMVVIAIPKEGRPVRVREGATQPA